MNHKTAECIAALREVTEELHQLHAHHYGQCEGGCPAETFIKRANAALAALDKPEDDGVTGRFCYSTDEESFTGKFTTAGEAAGAAIDALESDGEPGETRYFWIGQCCHPVAKINSPTQTAWLGDQIAEDIDIKCGEEVGGEDACVVLDKTQTEELGRLVLDFMLKNASVAYYGVENIEKHEHVIGSDA